MPFLVRPARLAFHRHDGRVDARQRNRRRAGLDRQQVDAVGIAERRPAGFGLPHVIDDRDAIPQNPVLQPVPRRRIEHFARAHDPLEPRVIDAQQRFVAVAHQHPHGRRRREDPGGAELFDDDPPVGFGVGMIERALEHDGRAADEQRRIHHVAVADDPADVGSGPPHIGRLHAEAPPSHADDVDLIAAVRVDGELGLRGGAGGRENPGRLVGLHPLARR